MVFDFCFRYFVVEAGRGGWENFFRKLYITVIYILFFSFFVFLEAFIKVFILISFDLSG